jgi:hypothetical protein
MKEITLRRTYVIYLLFLSLLGISQPKNEKENTGITEVKFTLMHPMRGKNNHVNIHVNKVDTIHSVSVKVVLNDTVITKKKSVVLDKHITLSNYQYNQLVNSLVAITCLPVKEALNRLNKEGNIYVIRFGNDEAKIEYQFWNPNYNTNERDLKPFLNTCKYIVEMCGLDPKDILQ